MLADLFNDICRGQSDAYNFVVLWMNLINEIDDIIDEERDNEKIIGAFLRCELLFGTNKFYQEYWNILYPALILSANAYADSVAWEKSREPWKQDIATVIRSYGNEMLCLVAYIVGGWDHMRSISLRLRERSYNDHIKIGH